MRWSDCHGEEEELLEEEFHLLGDGGELPVILLDAREHRVLECLVVRALRQVGDFVGDGDTCLSLTRPASSHRVVAVQRVVRVGEHARGREIRTEEMAGPRRGILAEGALAVA